jgi:hypothetical protein
MAASRLEIGASAHGPLWDFAHDRLQSDGIDDFRRVRFPTAPRRAGN